MIALRPLTGATLEAALDDVAALRIEVFREWPYLYDGTVEYERAYLENYRRSSAAIVIGAFHGDRLVGAATGSPMEDHNEAFSAALATLGLPLEKIFYCGESVLLPAYRGHGVGHRFFDLREDHAAALRRSHITFCTVIRPPDHPLCPAAARSNDAFWRGRGYRPLPDVVAEFEWTDLGQTVPSAKPLQFWMRQL